jgi:hypothetical protein
MAPILDALRDTCVTPLLRASAPASRGADGDEASQLDDGVAAVDKALVTHAAARRRWILQLRAG